jgi:hypothetical protein
MNNGEALRASLTMVNWGHCEWTSFNEQWECSIGRLDSMAWVE